jgi:hypothetical protein
MTVLYKYSTGPQSVLCVIRQRAKLRGKRSIRLAQRGRQTRPHLINGDRARRLFF